MVSCTEFIPMYSELFKYIDEKSGHDAVVRYWEHIREAYSRPMLSEYAAKYGVLGCFKYWTHTLNEEAADFVMTYDDETDDFTIDMRRCPSRSMLDNMEHIEPYYDYCGHCAYLYAPVLADYGIECGDNFTYIGNASCKGRFYKRGGKR